MDHTNVKTFNLNVQVVNQDSIILSTLGAFKCLNQAYELKAKLASYLDAILCIISMIIHLISISQIQNLLRQRFWETL